MKHLKSLLMLLLATIALLFVGCQDQTTDGQVVQGSYTWLRSGETLEESGLHFSVDEISHLVISTRINNVTIGTHNGSDVLIEYVPDASGAGRYYHHVVRPRYELMGDRLEIFRDVNLEPNTFIRGGTINILVPIHDGVMFESVSITTTSGDVRMSNFNSSNIRIDTSNGIVGLTSLNADNITIHTTINDIDVANVDIESNLTLQTTHGNIDVSNSYIGGTLSATTTFADIVITNVDTNIDSAKLDASRGDVIIN